LSRTEDLAKLSKFFQAARIAILQVDETGACQSANDAWVELSGNASAASLGFGWKSFLPAELLSKLLPMTAENNEAFLNFDISRHGFFRAQLNVQVLPAVEARAGSASYFLLFNVAQVTWSPAGLLSQAAGTGAVLASERGEMPASTVQKNTSANTAASVETSAPAKKPLVGFHVLLVEDSPVGRTIAMKLLESVGCTVVTASDGREAVSRAALEKFDVILMDCEMPEMDGFEATRVIRSSCPRNSGVAVIALTGDATPENERKCFHSGMNAHISKPFDPEFLARTILRYAHPHGSDKVAV
jgi:CheY-like chemotaxis protein